MRALRSLLAIPLALLPLACGGETKAPAPTLLTPATAVPAAALPRVGTIADPPAGAFEIAVAADGTLFAGPREVDLDGLEEAIRAAMEASPGRTRIGEWARDVTMRVASTTPWEVVTWVMRLLAAPLVRAYRLHFAVLPEEGDQEGTFAVWLPRDKGSLSYRVHALGITAEAAPTTVSAGRAYAEILRSLGRLEEPRGVSLNVGPGVATGNVLKVVDWSVRAGAALVEFEDWPPPPPGLTARGGGGRTALREWVAANPVRDGGVALTVAGVRLTEDSTDGDRERPPSVARVARATEPAASAGGALGSPEDPSMVERSSPAVEAALEWLAAHQSPDGQWEAEGFDGWCDRKNAAGQDPLGHGKAQYDVGVTGLALLAFLGAGYTNRSNHRHGKVVGDGLRYLKNVQDKEGCFGNRKYGHYVYNHAIAAIAMVEAFRATGSAIYVNPAKRAVDFVLLARNPSGGWRYGIQPDEEDTSITGWMALALASASRTNAEFAARGKPPPFPAWDDARRDVLTFLDRMTDAASGRVGYMEAGRGPARPAEMVEQFPQENSEATTATATLLRSLLGGPDDEDLLRKGADLVSGLPPRWDLASGFVDMDYWLMGTLALRRLGGGRWATWSEEARSAILGAQRKDGDPCGVKGSWDPLDPWGPDGGRVYSTAVLCMCCEALAGSERVIAAPSR